jgi:hypothetical protein
MIIYQLLKEQDVFHTFYRLLLSQRLIQNQYSMDSEVKLLNHLKLKCSYDKIYKIQRMFSDLSHSDSLKENYKSESKDSSIFHLNSKSVEFKPLILTTGSWPLKYSISDFKIPSFVIVSSLTY